MVTIRGLQMVPVLVSRTGSIQGPFRTCDGHNGTIWGPHYVQIIVIAVDSSLNILFKKKQLLTALTTHQHPTANHSILFSPRATLDNAPAESQRISHCVSSVRCAIS